MKATLLSLSKKMYLSVLGLALAVLALPAVLLATTQLPPANLGVSATVSAACSILSVTNIAFPQYNPLGVNATQPAVANGRIEITCNQTQTTMNIALNGGAHESGTIRRMKITTGTEDYLRYDLYADSGYNSGWDIGANLPATTLSSGPTSGKTFVKDIYGKIPPANTFSQTPNPGDYTDTVVMNITY